MTDVSGWLANLSTALRSADGDAVAQLFLPDGLWRDFLAFGWTLATYEGRDQISKMVAARAMGTAAAGWTTETKAGDIEGFISFSTSLGPAMGYVRLKDGQCVTFFTALQELSGHEFPLGPRRPSGVVKDPDGRNWRDFLDQEATELGTTVEPFVLVVGAGQAGLAIGAGLRLLGVPCLLVDSFPRVGDQWRSRYRSLTLHDPVWYDHMPFLSFPDHWPVFTPKDKMGDWLEFYANAMELNIWNDTQCVGARYDEANNRWNVVLRRGDRELTLHPRHLVMAVGNAGFPHVPDFAGRDQFRGQQHHSSQHPGGEGLRGKRIVVVGANNSALDIAADAALHDADVTMIQRSSTNIIRQEMLCEMLKPLYSEEALAAGMTTERADLYVASMPIRLLEQTSRQFWDSVRVTEGAYYDRIEKAGFQIDFGVDGTGFQMKYMRTASGYYYDVGAMEMIIDQRIKVQPATGIERVTEDGLVLEGGAHIPADMIVYATGFGAMEEWVSRLIGDDVASKIGKCWGYGSGTAGDPGPWEGELRNMWKPTAQPGLWFMGGSLSQVRANARYLALQLKARYEGIKVEPYIP
jgi:putative flavoprotein involved in K+ transport